jgi:O-antigen/teichoic acid export membrane protein
MFYVGLDSFLIQRIFGEKFLTSLPAFHALFITIPFFTYSIILSGILQGIGKVKELAISYLLALLFGVPVLILAGTLSLTVMAVGLSLIIIIRAIFLHSVYTRLLQ